MGKEPGVSEAVRAAFLYGKMIVLSRLFRVAVGFKCRDQWRAGLEGFLQPLYITGLPVIEAVQWSDVENDLFLRDFFAGAVGDPDGLNQAKIRLTIVCKTLNVHNTLRNRPIDLLLYYTIKKQKKQGKPCKIRKFFTKHIYSSGKLGCGTEYFSHL